MLNGSTKAANMGWYLYSTGKDSETEKVDRVVAEGREKALGREDLDTLCRFSTLVIILKKRGKLRDAKVMLRRVMEGCKNVLGIKDSNTSASVENLGLVLEKQGKYMKREPYIGSVWKQEKKC